MKPDWTTAPRQSRNTTPIKPAKRGFFHALRRDSIPRVLLEWTVLLGIIGGLIVTTTGCTGVSDAQAEALVQADASAAPKEQLPEVIIQEVDMLLVQIEGERPEEISEADWAAVQNAKRILLGQPAEQAQE